MRIRERSMIFHTKWFFVADDELDEDKSGEGESDDGNGGKLWNLIYGWLHRRFSHT